MTARRHLQWSEGAAGPVLAVMDAEQDELAWQDRARCAEVDPELHFPEKGGSTREAKRVCRGCEVRAECLEYALDHDERFGIWGGLSERERRQLKRARPARAQSANQPPKRPAATEPGMTRIQKDAQIRDILACGEKHCPRCEKAKPLDDFPSAPGRADGRGYWCNTCVADYKQERRRLASEAA